MRSFRWAAILAAIGIAALLALRPAFRSAPTVRGLPIPDAGSEVRKPAVAIPDAAVASDGWDRTVDRPRLEPAGELGVVRGRIPFPPLAGPLALFPPSLSPMAATFDAGGLVALRGRVGDERGFAILGARITGRAGSWQGEAISDSEGRFALSGMAEGAAIELEATHPQHPRTRVVAVGGEEARIRLVPGGGVEGEVRDEQTRAVVRAAEVDIACGTENRRTLSDPLGRFRILGCAAGLGRLTVRMPRYLTLTRSIDIPTADRPGEVTLRDQQIALTLGGGVVGVVRDRRGRPAAGMTVLAADIRALTDPKGRFRLSPMAPGRVEVLVGAMVESVMVDAGRETHVDLRLR